MKKKVRFIFLVGLLTAGVNPGFLFGKTLIFDYSTYLGGSGEDCAQGISLGTDGRVYLAGYATSSDFPTDNPYQAGYGGGACDVFVSALTSTGSTLLYSTFVGGSGADDVRGMGLDSEHNVYLTGKTASRDFPVTPESFDDSLDGETDAFLFILNLLTASITGIA